VVLGGLWAATYNLLLLPTTVVKNIMVFNREQAERALPTLMNGSVPGTTGNVVRPLQGGTGSSLNETKKPNDAVTYRAADSQYSSAAHLLRQAQETLAKQQKEAAEKLENVHRYYEGMMKKPPDSERPSAPNG
jgi:hypothetical protein